MCQQVQKSFCSLFLFGKGKGAIRLTVQIVLLQDISVDNKKKEQWPVFSMLADPRKLINKAKDVVVFCLSCDSSLDFRPKFDSFSLCIKYVSRLFKLFIRSIRSSIRILY